MYREPIKGLSLKVYLVLREWMCGVSLEVLAGQKGGEEILTK
jgi:hypothetical protein